MRVLLTGNKGFIGREIEEVLTKENAIEVVGLDCDGLFDKFEYAFEHFQLYGGIVDCVIHCGAISDSRATGNLLWQLNYHATCKIAEYCEATDTRLIFMSSAAAIAPSTAYGWSKNCAEFYLNHRVAGMNLCILRPFNVWAFDEDTKTSPSIVYKILTGQLEVIYANCVRDFIYLTDVVDAVQQVVNTHWTPGTFSLGTAHPTTILELVEMISDAELPIVECPIEKERVAKVSELLPDWEATPITEYYAYSKEVYEKRKDDPEETSREHLAGEAVARNSAGVKK